MTGPSRGLCALLVVLGTLAPSGAGSAAAAHELIDHGSFASLDAVTFAALFHGHRHPSNAPDHEHALSMPSPPARPAHGVIPLKRGCEYRAAVPAPATWAVLSAFERPTLAKGAGPPPGISPLRV